MALTVLEEIDALDAESIEEVDHFVRHLNASPVPYLYRKGTTMNPT